MFLVLKYLPYEFKSYLFLIFYLKFDYFENFFKLRLIFYCFENLTSSDIILNLTTLTSEYNGYNNTYKITPIIQIYAPKYKDFDTK